MRTYTVADAKAHLSAVLAEVEAGSEVVITRRGLAVARIIREPQAVPADFDLAELFAFVDSQPMHSGNAVAELRAQERY